MKRKLNYLLVMSMIVFFVQCSKEDSPIELSVDTVIKGIQNKNGRLIFKDSTVFMNHVNWVIQNQNNPNVIEDFNKNLGIVSLNTIFQTGMNITDENEFKAYRQKHPDAFVVENHDDAEFIELPCPNAFSYIANKEGIFQVDNIVSKVIANNIITKEYTNEIAVVDLIQNNFKGFGVTVSQKYYKTAYRSSKYRLVGKAKLYSYSSGMNVYEGISITQRKRLGVWVRSDLAGEVRVTWNYKMYYKDNNNVAHYLYDNGTKPNGGSRVSTTVFAYNRYNLDMQVNISRSWCKVTHYGANKSIGVGNVFTAK